MYIHTCTYIYEDINTHIYVYIRIYIYIYTSQYPPISIGGVKRDLYEKGSRSEKIDQEIRSRNSIKKFDQEIRSRNSNQKFDHEIRSRFPSEFEQFRNSRTRGTKSRAKFRNSRTRGTKSRAKPIAFRTTVCMSIKCRANLMEFGRNSNNFVHFDRNSAFDLKFGKPG